MSHTGDVCPDKPRDIRFLPAMTITTVVGGYLKTNMYLLRCTATGQQLLIDAAADPDRLLNLIGKDGLSAIVTTHCHRDHWQALLDVTAHTGAPSLAHEADAADIPGVSRTLHEGDRLFVGNITLEVIHLAGHTPGGIALLYDDPDGIAHLFTGDSLFPGGVGSTGSKKDVFQSLMDDVERKIFDRLPDSTWFYPGHGPGSTVGEQRPSLPVWRARGW